MQLKARTEEVKFESAMVDNPIVPEPTLEEILAFELLITNRRLKLQIIFAGVDPAIALEAKEQFEANPLIEFFQDREGSDEWIMV